MKRKSNKLKELEQNRYSIFTDNFKKCYYCNMQIGTMDIHEVYGR